MMDMIGLFKLVEVNRINGDKEDKDMWADTSRRWRLVAQTDTGQCLEFKVVAEALRGMIKRGEVKKSGAKKNVWAGRRFLTSLDRSTLIKVIYRIYPDGDMTVFDWWEASDKEAALWGIGTEPREFRWVLTAGRLSCLSA